MCKLLNMKRILLTLLAVLTLLPLSAQTKQSQKDYLDRYNLLVSKLGADGVGIETLLQRWEKDYPEDTDMLLGKFSYYLTKSQSASIESRIRRSTSATPRRSRLRTLLAVR